MRKIERLDKYMKTNNLNDNQITVACGLSVGLLGKARQGKSDIGDKAIEKILTIYQDINRIWLITGEGDMLKYSESTPKSGQENTVLLLPIYAQGGSLNDFTASIRQSDCERIISPIKGADWAIEVAGDSMAPEFPSGSRILIKKINERAFIEWGKVHVLDTCNGIVVKELRRCDEPGVLTCYSINPNPKYAPFNVNTADIYGIYRVMMCLSIK